ncbi:MAG: DUF4105 domain-containing protein, partial [Salinisphaera sp.]|nr:DUF4105 domain-containing protein [Salinisphaera sp.]
PYYDKVKEYAWIESRDIWDYRLQLSARQRNRLMAHLWALQGVHFTYYFLSRNCSYQLLALLQAAMPKLQLVEQFDLYALPADTIRALAAVPGLLGHAGYRPALATTLASHARTMSQQALAIAIALARGQAEPDGRRVQTLPPQTRARVLELAHDYLYYRHLGGAYSAELTRTRAGAILLARSRITTHANWPQVPAPDTPPHAGHESRRIALTSAWGATGFHLGVDFRLAYHGLLDPPGGYVGGAGVKLFDIALRLDPNAQGHALQLAHLTLIDLVSISPRGPFFKPLSWRLSTGLRQRPIAAPFHPDAHLGFYLQGGPGLAWGSLDTITWYSFALLSADLNHGFDQGYAVAGGASAGLLAYPLAGWQIKAEAGLLENAIGDDGHRAWLRLAQQWPLIGAWQLRLGLGWYGTARDDHARAALGLATYF